MYCYFQCSVQLFLMVPWVDLQCVIVVFLGHTHLLFNWVTLITGHLQKTDHKKKHLVKQGFLSTPIQVPG